jgi:phosphatidylglycerophosphate synthase
MSHDTWIHRMIRPAVRPLARTPVTPNQLTWLRLLSGVAAALAFSQGEDLWRNWGAALFLVSFLLDRADGQLARLSGKTSAYGHKLDLASDALANGLAFLGLGIGLRDGVFGLWALGMGALAGLALGAILLLVVRVEATAGERAAELRSVAGFDPDDGILLLPLLVWLGFAELLLVLAAVGAPLFCLAMAITLRRRLARPVGPGGGPAAR